MQVNETSYELTLEDFEIVTEDIPGWQVASDGPITVALDVTLNDELRAEGMARELVNRIQNLRKDKGFEVTDRIRIQLEKHDGIVPAIEKFGDYITSETLAVQLELVEQPEDADEITLPDELTLGIRVNLN